MESTNEYEKKCTACKVYSPSQIDHMECGNCLHDPIKCEICRDERILYYI